MSLLRKKIRWICLGSLILAGAAWLTLLLIKWPFSSTAVAAALQHEWQRPVHIASFRSTWFPVGYVAANITVAKSSSADPSITIRKLVITANVFDILLARHRIEKATITGLKVFVPSPGPDTQPKKSSGLQAPRFAEIGRIELDNSVFLFAASEGDPDTSSINLQHAVVININQIRPATFAAQFLTTGPTSHVSAQGQIGPLDWNESGRTPLSGSFVLDRGDLASLGGVGGSFNATGKFGGLLNKIESSGTVIVPDFQVSGNRSVYLGSTFRATVNGINGDTTLEDIESRFKQTVVRTQGTIRSDSLRVGKTSSLRMSVVSEQLGDLLALFTKEGITKMTGSLNVKADVELPPGPPGFLKKLRMDGDFVVGRGLFTKALTQRPIDDLSKSAGGMSRREQQQNPQAVLSGLKGHVATNNGIANLTGIAFTVPGVQANLGGTYSLLSHVVNLRGILTTSGKLSDAASGMKSTLLKLVTPFVRKDSVTIVPFSITGQSGHLAFALSLSRRHRGH